MELTTLAPTEEPRFCHLAHPSTGQLLYSDADKKEAVGIWLLSTDSDKATSLAHRKANKRLKLRDRTGAFKITSEATAEEAFKFVSDITSKVDNLEFAGETVTADNIITVYRNLRWVFDQVDLFAAERANYLGEA